MKTKGPATSKTALRTLSSARKNNMANCFFKLDTAASRRTSDRLLLCHHVFTDVAPLYGRALQLM